MTGFALSFVICFQLVSWFFYSSDLSLNDLLHYSFVVHFTLFLAPNKVSHFRSSQLVVIWQNFHHLQGTGHFSFTVAFLGEEFMISLNGHCQNSHLQFIFSSINVFVVVEPAATFSLLKHSSYLVYLIHWTIVNHQVIDF